MTPKSLFIIVIRVIGLFLLVDVLRIVPQFLSTLLVLLKGDFITAGLSALITLLILFVYFTILKYVLFNPHKIVEKLNLDKNFDEEKFELNIHRSTVIRIALFFIGGTTLLNHFVPLVINLFIYIKNKNRGEIFEVFDRFGDEYNVSEVNLVTGILMCLIGYFIITNTRAITNWIEKRGKNGSV